MTPWTWDSWSYRPFFFLFAWRLQSKLLASLTPDSDCVWRSWSKRHAWYFINTMNSSHMQTQAVYSRKLPAANPHSNLGPSALWTVPRCLLKWLFRANFLPQTSHSCLGPSVLWIFLRWWLKYRLTANFLPQTSHLCLAPGCSGRGGGGALMLLWACAVS